MTKLFTLVTKLFVLLCKLYAESLLPPVPMAMGKPANYRENIGKPLLIGCGILIMTACMDMGASLEGTHHPGVWAPRSGAYSCCGQENREAPGCTHQAKPPYNTPLVEVNKGPIYPREYSYLYLEAHPEDQCVSCVSNYVDC